MRHNRQSLARGCGAGEQVVGVEAVPGHRASPPLVRAGRSVHRRSGSGVADETRNTGGKPIVSFRGEGVDDVVVVLAKGDVLEEPTSLAGAADDGGEQQSRRLVGPPWSGSPRNASSWSSGMLMRSSRYVLASS